MELFADIKYVICGKSNRAIDVYVAPYIQPVKPDATFDDIRLMVSALKLKSGFEWKVVLRDVDDDNKFTPVEITNEYDRELPILSMELFQYTKEFTMALRDGKLLPYNHDQIGDKTPALVYVMLLTCNKEYQMIIPVDVYIAFSTACEEYYGGYNTLPWGIKRALGAHTQQFHIRLCVDSELTYARCMEAKRASEVKISPIMDCIDIETTLQETAKFSALVADAFHKYTIIGRELQASRTTPSSQDDKSNNAWQQSHGQRLGSAV